MRPTKAQIGTERAELSKENTVLAIALQSILTDTPDYQIDDVPSADGDWSYEVRLYRSTAPHGGIIVMRSHCVTNFQADIVRAMYLDDASGYFRYDMAPDLHAAFDACRRVRKPSVIGSGSERPDRPIGTDGA